MRKTISLTVSVLGLVAFATASAQSTDEMIAQAIQPLPEDLRADAAVYNYNDASERVMLREGSNHVECKPRDERGFTLCFPKNTAARRDFSAKLTADGLEGEELQAAVAAAEEAGTIEPTPFGSILYRLYEEDDKIQLLWVVLLPNATSEDLGMSTESQRDNSLAGMGRPWMMRPGTPQAHLMIPINGTDMSNAGGAKMAMDTKAIDDMVTQATLPLPEDLRAGATVVSYDKETGERKTLREGSNMIACQPRDEESGFTRCGHKDNLSTMDLQAKLGAEGKSNEEIQAAIAAAQEDGTIAPRKFGQLFYRLYEEDDRLKLLWVLRVPDATAADLGMPTGSQRDNSLAGQGTPWMMREGTQGAHLMIPINGTELSN
jgi:DNA-binding transcriptional MerR regulator